MNSNFDLTVSNYTKPELEQLFDLPTIYDESVVEIQETKLRQNIMNDSSITSIVKNQTLTFITDVKKLLMNRGSGSGSGSCS